MSSRNGQDEWVIETLRDKREGYFIDSGAAHSRINSNTFRLEIEYGWSGICVEPNPALFATLKQDRMCHCVMAALSNKAGTAKLTIPEMGSGELGALDEFLVNDMWKRHREAAKRIVVETVTIWELLVKFNAPEVIDYWSLDTEGSEDVILESFPWALYRVLLLSVEHNFVEAKKLKVREFMQQRGYSVVEREQNLAEDYFIHSSVDRSPFVRPQTTAKITQLRRL